MSLLYSSASVTPLHGVMSARRDVINVSQRAALPLWCQLCVNKPLITPQAHLSQLCWVHSLQDVFHSWPVQRDFTRMTKKDRPPFIQQKVTSHLKKKHTLKLYVFFNTFQFSSNDSMSIYNYM